MGLQRSRALNRRPCGKLRGPSKLTLFENPSLQNPYMIQDRYYGHPTLAPLQTPSRQPGLPHFSSQANAYGVDNGRSYPSNIVPSQMVAASTLDPSILLHRQIPMYAVPEESDSDSDDEMDCADASDGGWDHQADDEKDRGWEDHPETIGMGIPKFYATKAKADMRDADGRTVVAMILALIVLKRAVAQQKDYHILYRRNYFGVQGSYTLNCLPESASDELLYLHPRDHEPIPIQGLYMCMRGVMDTEEGPEIKIVVFNAKRKPLHHGRDPPPIEPQRMKPLKEGSSHYFSASTGSREDNMTVPMNHTFHRNQFRAATQNNGARRTDQQVYHILLELKAEVVVDGVTQLVTVASRMSEPLVVRGRCPLSFQVSEHESEKNDPDPKGKKPSRGGAARSKKGSNTQSKIRKAKAASRKSCKKPDSSSRRATRASSRLPSLSYGTGSGSNNTALMTPQMFHANGTLNSKTIPQLDERLRGLAPGQWEKT